MTSNDFNKYGVPAQKKFPMPDADHVRSAIKFFNYVSPQYEKILARAILQRAKEYGVDLSEMSIGDENRFKKYLPENELKHHGILGQKWGIRRFQNPDGTLTEKGKKRYLKKYEHSMKRADYERDSRKDAQDKLTDLKRFGQYSNTYRNAVYSPGRLNDYDQGIDIDEAYENRTFDERGETRDQFLVRRYIEELESNIEYSTSNIEKYSKKGEEYYEKYADQIPEMDEIRKKYK